MRWSEKETYRFVQIYFKHDCLWNSKHEDYKERIYRQTAYRQITEELKSTTRILLNVTEVKKKIKNLRSTYSQELNKIRKRSTPNRQFQSSIKWFKLWHEKMKETSYKYEDFELEYPDQNVPESTEDSSNLLWTPNDSENHDYNPVSQSDEYINTTKSESDDDMCAKEKKINKPHQYRNMQEDEFDIYGTYIASQLRQMSLQKALSVQLEIQSLMSKARLSSIT